jgi:hypothetical protein
MMQTQWLRPDQERAIRIYMEKFGTDAGVRAIVDFEKGKSLGRAMIKHRDQQRGDYCESDTSESVQI